MYATKWIRGNEFTVHRETNFQPIFKKIDEHAKLFYHYSKYSYHRISFETYSCRYLSSPQKHTVTYLKQKEKRKIRQFKINGKASSPISILERVSKTIQKLQNSTSSLLLHPGQRFGEKTQRLCEPAWNRKESSTIEGRHGSINYLTNLSASCENRPSPPPPLLLIYEPLLFSPEATSVRASLHPGSLTDHHPPSLPSFVR